MNKNDFIGVSDPSQDTRKLTLPDGHTVEQFIKDNIETLPNIRFKGLATKLKDIKLKRYAPNDVKKYIIELAKNWEEFKCGTQSKRVLQKINELSLPVHFYGEGYSYKETKECLDTLATSVRTAIVDYESGQFIALGLTGSGKTSYLTALYSALAREEDGFTIHADSDSEKKLQSYHDKLKLEKCADVIPATDQSNKYSFTLKYNNSEIEKFQWIDYPGGWIKQDTKEQQDQIKTNISNAKAIYIIVDGEKFFPEDKTDEELILNMKDNLTIYLSNFMDHYSCTETSNPPIIFIVTKSDVIMKNYPYEDAADISTRIIKKAFKQYFSEVLDNVGLHNIVSIIPVRLGQEYYKNENQGGYNPVNVQIPLFIGLYFLLEYNVKRIRQSDKVDIPKKLNAQKRLKAKLEEYHTKSKDTDDSQKVYKVFYDGREMSFAEAVEKFLTTNLPKNGKGKIAK